MQFVFLMGLFLSSALMAADQGPKSLGSFGKWTAYEAQEAGKKVCYMLADPIKQEGDFKARGRVYAMITHRPDQKSFDVFSHHAGYTFKKGSPVTLSVKAKKDPKSFDLFSEKDAAWASDEGTDKEIAKALSTGASFDVSGISSKGTATKDTYSLEGSTAAYKKITQACAAKK